jgi:hypothetical protein
MKAKKAVTVTRLRALLSYGRLRGRGIRLEDILLVGSCLDIDTGDRQGQRGSRPVYAIVGLFVGAGVDLLINLLAAAIQEQAFADQFSTSAILWLVGFSVVGLLVGHWLGGEVRVSEPKTDGKEDS